MATIDMTIRLDTIAVEQMNLKFRRSVFRALVSCGYTGEDGKFHQVDAIEIRITPEILGDISMEQCLAPLKEKICDEAKRQLAIKWSRTDG